MSPSLPRRPRAPSRRRGEAASAALRAARAASRRRAKSTATTPAGFTLLEVLVAVAVLGLIYVTVARVAIQGMQSAGDASRRLEASLLADRALGEVETQIARGQTPRLGEQTREEGPYSVEVVVEPFSAEAVGLAPALAELDPPRASDEAGRRRPGESTRRDRGARSLALLEPPRRGAEPALLAVSVRVAWQDASRERSVTRATFALDRSVAASRLEDVAAEDEQRREASEEDAREEPSSEGEATRSPRSPGSPGPGGGRRGLGGAFGERSGDRGRR